MLDFLAPPAPAAQAAQSTATGHLPETVIMLEGDRKGEVTQLKKAAALMTFIPPPEAAIKIERGFQVNIEARTVRYWLNPAAIVDGVLTRTAFLKDALNDHGGFPDDLTHRLNDAISGIHNADAIRQWLLHGTHHRLQRYAGDQRARYVPGSPDILTTVETAQTPWLSKAAALGLLGMPLYNITGTRDAPLYNVVRYSQGMRDATGEPITYDAAQLIMDEIEDRIDIRHPFVAAHLARVHVEVIWQELQRTDPLIYTPDIVDRGIPYNWQGPHFIASANATGPVMDLMERMLVG